MNDGEPIHVNTFYKDSDQLMNSNEEIIDKYIESLEVLFKECMIKYTMVFNEIKPSNYSEVPDVFNNILEYERTVLFLYQPEMLVSGNV